MMLSSLANQGSIFHWARDHTIHHKFSETEKDPYNINYGFFYAHMFGLFFKKNIYFC